MLNKNRNGSWMVQEDNVACLYIITRRQVVWWCGWYGIRVGIGSILLEPGWKTLGRCSCVNTTKHREQNRCLLWVLAEMTVNRIVQGYGWNCWLTLSEHWYKFMYRSTCVTGSISLGKPSRSCLWNRGDAAAVSFVRLKIAFRVRVI